MKLAAMKLSAVVMAAAMSLSACATASPSATSASSITKLGKSEGTLSLLGWPGYAEDGSNDPKVDWVTPFEKATGCNVTFKSYGTSDEALNLFKTGNYDAIAASGDATLRLIASGSVQPLNTSLIPSYKGVYPFLKNRAWNTVDGKTYGVPHGYGANLLMYKKDVVKPAPTSWNVVFEGSSAYKGHVTSYDSPIYIADAAVYLMAHKPELGIKNPYALDDKQLKAAVDLLKAQRANIGEYWSDYLKEISAFESGDSVVGTTWQVIINSMSAKANVGSVLPSEGQPVGATPGWWPVTPSTSTVLTSGLITLTLQRLTLPQPSTLAKPLLPPMPASTVPRDSAKATTPETRSTQPRSGTGPLLLPSVLTVAPMFSAPTTPPGRRPGKRLRASQI